jgi:TPR repeat protein
MTSGAAPWSVKGIDPKAREIAKDLARRSGMTLGEWLNQVIMEDDPLDGQPALQAPAPGWAVQDRPAAAPRSLEEVHRVTSALDRLSERIEAAENRSTHAISGIDQSVAGLVSRLTGAERDQTAVAARFEGAVEDLRNEQAHVAERLRRIEQEAMGPRSAEALRAMEGALAKVATHLYEGEARSREALEGLRRDVDGVAQKLNETGAAPGAELLESAVAQFAQRLEHAEHRTSSAMRALESSLSQLDNRLGATEEKVEGSHTGLEQLASNLSARVDEARLEMAEKIRATADGRFDRMERTLQEMTGHVQAAERRSAGAIEKMGQEVLRMADVMNRKVQEVDERATGAMLKVGGEMSRIASVMETRLDRIDGAGAQALEKLGSEIARITERLTERIAAAEQRSAQAFDDASEQMARFGERLQDRHERTSSDLADRIRQSEERTARLLEDARERIDRRLADVQQRAAEAPAHTLADPAVAPFGQAEPAAAPRAFAYAAPSRQVFGPQSFNRQSFDPQPFRAAAPLPAAHEPEAAEPELLDEALDIEALETAAFRAEPAEAEAVETEHAAEGHHDPLLDEAEPFAETASFESTLPETAFPGTAFSETPFHAPAEAAPEAAHEEAAHEEAAHASAYGAEAIDLPLADPDIFGPQRFDAVEPFEALEDDDEAHEAAEADADERIFRPFGAAAFGPGHFEPAPPRAGAFDVPADFPSSLAGEPRSFAEALAGFDDDDHHEHAADAHEPAEDLLEPEARTETLFQAEPAHALFPEPPRGDPAPFAAAGPSQGPLSTRDIIEQARAAARAAAEAQTAGRAGSKSRGSLFAGLNRGRPKAAKPSRPKSAGGALKVALLGSGTVAACSLGLALAIFLVEKPSGPLPKPVAEALAVDGANHKAAALLAMTLTPKPVAGDPASATQGAADIPAVQQPAAPADGAPELYANGVQKIEARDDTGLPDVQKAANLGYAPAEFFLAKLYEGGEAGVKKDAVEARRWTERAAEGGDRKAMHNLALYYFEGTGGPKNTTTAAQWFRRAAEAGLVDSQYNLGRLYEEGFGVAQNPAEAYKWYLIASASGDAESRASAKRLKSELTAEAQAAAERAAQSFQPQTTEPAQASAAAPANNNVATAQRALSHLGYFQGPADGVASPALKYAIAAFQRDRNLPATGQLDPTVTPLLNAAAQ